MDATHQHDGNLCSAVFLSLNRVESMPGTALSHNGYTQNYSQEAAARVSGVYTLTLLILDGCPSIVFEGFFDFYSHDFLDPENHFQTLMCIPTRSIDPDNIRWNGWQIVHMEGKDPDAKLQTGFEQRGHLYRP
ncbi:hypothetical protein EDE15_4248 [Edaphobacter aggregans]|uniref:Uncharacterized protein n=1 Tax=Edaphobacter aggregans TaxID=570835 RepID=A0A3R9QCW4_9BACT|nr:hypothetical protein [Edaphobacter aggregans]RSL18654.1 hypothetical protein EDE15_4248 [Edaphobacter aggregans]